MLVLFCRVWGGCLQTHFKRAHHQLSLKLELGGMTKNAYHGIFLNYTTLILFMHNRVLTTFSTPVFGMNRYTTQHYMKHLWCTPILRAIIIISLFNLLCFSPLNPTLTEQCFIVCKCVHEGKLQQLGLNKQLYLFALGSPPLLFSFSQLPLRALAPTFLNCSMHVSHKHR